MVCEFMGAAGDTVTNAVTSNFNNNNNGQFGQITSQNFQQFASNPNQFIQQFPGQQRQQFTNQLVGNNRPLGQLINNGQQFVTTGQQLVQNQYPNQFNQFQTQFASPSNQFSSQTQFIGPQSQFGGGQFNGAGAGQQSSGGILDNIASGIASALGKKRRRKRQTSIHGQAIRMMQNLGMDNMGAYPFVRAAILGHANRKHPGSCARQYLECPNNTDLLLNYFNNHNGGLFQNTLPSVTNEVGSLFPGIGGVASSVIPAIAASTIGEASSPSGGSGDGLLNNFVDNLAGMIAQASLGK